MYRFTINEVKLKRLLQDLTQVTWNKSAIDKRDKEIDFSKLKKNWIAVNLWNLFDIGEWIPSLLLILQNQTVLTLRTMVWVKNGVAMESPR